MINLLINDDLIFRKQYSQLIALNIEKMEIPSDQSFNNQFPQNQKTQIKAKQANIAKIQQPNHTKQKLEESLQRRHHVSMNFEFNKINQRISEQIKKAMMNERQKIQRKLISNQSKTTNHQCRKCDCSGTTECGKKINFLEGKINEYLNFPFRKQVNQIYDIQKLGLNNQHYLVQFTDNSLEKLNVKYIKQNYLIDYVSFLERECFRQN